MSTFRDAVARLQGSPVLFGSPRELAENVDVTLRGRIQSGSDGRVVFPDPEDRDPSTAMQFVVYEVEVLQHLSGDPSVAQGDTVYVEMRRAALVEPAELVENAPDGDVLLALVDTTSEWPSEMVQDENAGRPDGTPVYTVHPAGFLYGTREGVRDVLTEVEGISPEWDDPQSLDEFSEAFASARD